MSKFIMVVLITLMLFSVMPGVQATGDTDPSDDPDGGGDVGGNGGAVDDGKTNNGLRDHGAGVGRGNGQGKGQGKKK